MTPSKITASAIPVTNTFWVGNIGLGSLAGGFPFASSTTPPFPVSRSGSSGSGGATVTIFDTASVQPWVYLLYGYDAPSRLDYIQLGYDNSSLVTVDYDQANAQAWSYVRYDYDAQSRLDSLQVGYDDGSWVVIDYDQANTTDWSYIYYTYDPQGAVVSTLVHWDDGTDSFAAAASTASAGDSSQASQLVQAMAGFGGGSGAADSLNSVALGADTSQQTLLTTPQQHA